MTTTTDSNRWLALYVLCTTFALTYLADDAERLVGLDVATGLPIGQGQHQPATGRSQGMCQQTIISATRLISCGCLAALRRFDPMLGSSLLWRTCSSPAKMPVRNWRKRWSSAWMYGTKSVSSPN